MIWVFASSFRGQLEFAAVCSHQVQCPRQVFGSARFVHKAGLGETLSLAGWGGGFWELHLEESLPLLPSE